MRNEHFMFLHFPFHNNIFYVDMLILALNLIILKEENCNKLSQYIFISLDMELNILRQKVKCLNQVVCVVTL
jgi:hypothetical protein